jgi:hypothetical protein
VPAPAQEDSLHDHIVNRAPFGRIRLVFRSVELADRTRVSIDEHLAAMS